MIKKILVALDPDSDTQTATRYAVEIASRTGGSVTGLAVVDMGSIAASTRGAGIGTMYFADKLRKRLTEETREKAQNLVSGFSAALDRAGVSHSELMQEGVPFRRILEDMKYHDMLIVGNEPHFFYSHPKQATETLARVVRKTVGPTLIVGKEHASINRVLIAFDGSESAARAMRTYAWFKPFGDVETRVVCVYQDSDTEAELTLGLARDFLAAHDITADTRAVQGNDEFDSLMEHARQFGANMVVAGAKSRSRIRSVAFGSTTSRLVEECPFALYLDS